jgi:hypothetical protein
VALAPLRDRFLSSSPTSRPGDSELIARHVPALRAARERLVALLHQAAPGDLRFCRRLSEFEIVRFDATNVSRVLNALMAARSEAVYGEASSRPPIPDGENYEVVSVSSTTLLS